MNPSGDEPVDFRIRGWTVRFILALAIGFAVPALVAVVFYWRCDSQSLGEDDAAGALVGACYQVAYVLTGLVGIPLGIAAAVAAYVLAKRKAVVEDSIRG